MATKKITLTAEQVHELRRLAKASEAAAEAADIRRRFKAFLDDNEDTLREGVTVSGLTLGVKISKQLTVEEAAGR